MKRKAKIFYTALDDFWRKEEKLNWLIENHISQIAFERIEPDAKNNWINQTDNDWDSLLPLIDKDVKAGKSEEAVFKLFAIAITTSRDEWVYDFSKDVLAEKMKYLFGIYNQSIKTSKMDYGIKWSSSLEASFKSKTTAKFSDSLLRRSFYRPFVKLFHYTEKLLNHRLTSNHFQMFGNDLNEKNLVIAYTRIGSPAKFSVLATDFLVDEHFTGDSQLFSLYTYSENQKHENITDWGLNQFRNHYGAKAEARASVRAENAEIRESTLADARVSASVETAKITKQDIFYYTYAVLHSPVYRKKYEQNLKREFPRLPFYDDFFQWRDWGKELMDLHINYESQTPFALVDNGKLIIDSEDKKDFIPAPKTRLRADKQQGTIEIDSDTILTGIPALAWEYKLGNRSALEWILDQYKEKKPKDATIAEHFNTYKFADYKEQVIELIKRVTNVSIKTMEIVNQMPDDV